MYILLDFLYLFIAWSARTYKQKFLNICNLNLNDSEVKSTSAFGSSREFCRPIFGFFFEFLPVLLVK